MLVGGNIVTAPSREPTWMATPAASNAGRPPPCSRELAATFTYENSPRHSTHDSTWEGIQQLAELDTPHSMAYLPSPSLPQCPQYTYHKDHPCSGAH